MYVCMYLTIISVTISWNMSTDFTNTGKIERTEKIAIMPEKRKLQISFWLGEDKSVILGYGGGFVRGDGDGDDKATYLALCFYNKYMRKHIFW